MRRRTRQRLRRVDRPGRTAPPFRSRDGRQGSNLWRALSAGRGFPCSAGAYAASQRRRHGLRPAGDARDRRASHFGCAMDGAMKRILVIAATLVAASCATTPKPCTAEWFDWKTDRYFDEFARDNRADIADLLVAARDLNKEGGRATDNLGAKVIA